MIFNEIKCHVNTSLVLVGGCIPCILAMAYVLLFFSRENFPFLDISFCMFKPVCTFKQV